MATHFDRYGTPKDTTLSGVLIVFTLVWTLAAAMPRPIQRCGRFAMKRSRSVTLGWRNW